MFSKSFEELFFTRSDYVKNKTIHQIYILSCISIVVRRYVKFVLPKLDS